MVLFNSGNEASFVFQIAGRNFRVVEFSLMEKISTPFELELTLASEDEIDFSAVIGNEALFSVLAQEAPRHVHGLVNRFEKTGTVKEATGIGLYLYNATVVPSLWVLSLEQDYRIFQKKTVPEIVRKILEEGGVAPDRISFKLQGVYAPREYCVQYRETDLNFVSRLLEEEGIFYYFDHRRDGHYMIFGDSPVNYQPIAGDPSLLFNPSGGMAADREFVFAFSRSQKLKTAKTTLRDFNFEKPSLDLTCQEQAQGKFLPEVYDYPGEYGWASFARAPDGAPCSSPESATR